MLTMAETATETITIAAAPDVVWKIATDLERYPNWAHDVKDVVVTARDDGGTLVRYDLAIELVVPLPGFVKRRAERRILNAIKEMKAFAEA